MIHAIPRNTKYKLKNCQRWLNLTWLQSPLTSRPVKVASTRSPATNSQIKTIIEATMLSKRCQVHVKHQPWTLVHTVAVQHPHQQKTTIIMQNWLPKAPPIEVKSIKSNTTIAMWYAEWARRIRTTLMQQLRAVRKSWRQTGKEMWVLFLRRSSHRFLIIHGISTIINLEGREVAILARRHHLVVY